MKRFLFQFDAICGGKETLGEKLGIGALLLRRLPRQEEHCAA